MAWGPEWPITNRADLQKYDTVIQVVRASRERAWVGRTPSEHYPGVTIVEDADPAVSYNSSAGYTGIADSITRNSDGTYTLTDSSKAGSWPASTGSCGGDSRWVNWTCFGAPWVAAFYDVVIEYDEANPWGVVRCQITANDNSGNLTLAGQPLDDALTAKQIASTSGTPRYCIVRRHTDNHPSRHWHERWPDWPNCTEYVKGIIGTAAATRITDADEGASLAGDYAGKNLMTRVGGKLARLTITASDRHSITFAEEVTPDAGAKYAVIDAGGRWRYPEPLHEAEFWPTPAKLSPGPGLLWWYGGFQRSFSTFHLANPATWSHYPDDEFRLTPTAAFQIAILQEDPGSPGSCILTNVDAFDKDVRTEYTNETCTGADLPHAPELYKAILRSTQAQWEADCTNGFVEEKSYDNLGAVPDFVPATWLRKADVNPYTTTVSTATVSGTPHITFPAITLPADVISSEILPLAVHYAILGGSGVPVAYGYSFAFTTSGGTYPSFNGNLISTTRIDLRGPTSGTEPYPPAQAVADTWVGMTLVISLGWDRHLPRELLRLYDGTAFIPSGGAVPPTLANPGSYLTRAASTTYAEYDVLGRITESGTPAFVAGHVARYRGSNWNDPTSGDVEAFDDADTPCRDLLNAYLEPDLSGTVDAFDGRSLRGRSFSNQTGFWWNAPVGRPPAPDGLRIDTGTATGGSATTLADTAKSGNAFWDGTTGRQVGFILECNGHKTPITAFNAGTQTLTFVAAPNLTVSAGDAYTIREPYKVNHYRDCEVAVVDNAGVEHRLAITHNDNDTLFFAPVPFVVLAGSRFRVLREQPGTTWMWDGAGHVQPEGQDPRGAPWRDDSRENLPTITRRFGRHTKGDYADVPEVWNQVYRGINALVWTEDTGHYEVAEINFRDTLPVPKGAGAFNDAKSTASAEFANGPPDTFDDNVTTVVPGQWKGLRNNAGTSVHAQIVSIHSYAVLGNAPTVRIKHSADAVIYTSTDADDVGEYDDPEGLSPPAGGYFDGTAGKMVFDAQGWNVYYRRYGKIASSGPSFDTSDVIKIGDVYDEPPDWPAAPADDDHTITNFASWSVVGNPVIIRRWNVSGGMTYVGSTS